MFFRFFNIDPIFNFRDEMKWGGTAPLGGRMKSSTNVETPPFEDMSTTAGSNDKTSFCK